MCLKRNAKDTCKYSGKSEINSLFYLWPLNNQNHCSLTRQGTSFFAIFNTYRGYYGKSTTPAPHGLPHFSSKLINMSLRKIIKSPTFSLVFKYHSILSFPWVVHYSTWCQLLNQTWVYSPLGELIPILFVSSHKCNFFNPLTKSVAFLCNFFKTMILIYHRKVSYLTQPWNGNILLDID